MKFSPTKGQFYPDDFGYREDDIPDDAIDVFEEDFTAAMARQPGDLLSVKDGRVVVLPALGVDLIERSAALERFWRSQRLLLTDAAVIRHRDEQEEGGRTTLSMEQYMQLQSFRRALRDWPESDDFPLIDHRPSAPDWLAEQLQ
ncbi:phage tail protein [Pseudomonas sp. SK3(2021)]|uniref:phage tail protein n=1 Tax=Pseudomonas sp. SK3(2021) TaxID=2841064 RepID=UPI00192A84A4|nr:phage tail protein [Pseudomonas sp. SK3(2021)]QQZ43264.1 phage tail protein [Pseudomonas sp. SK3(2021)]